MYQKIKDLADEAIALQNKNRMDAVLREISAPCDPEARPQMGDAKSMSTSFVHSGAADADGLYRHATYPAPTIMGSMKNAPDGYTNVTYGTGREFDTEAELIESIQGIASPVFPLPDAVLQAQSDQGDEQPTKPAKSAKRGAK